MNLQLMTINISKADQRAVKCSAQLLIIFLFLPTASSPILELQLHLSLHLIGLTLKMAGPRSQISGSSKREATTEQKLKGSQKRKRDQDSSAAESSKPASTKKTKKDSSSEPVTQNETAQKLKAPAEAGLQTGATSKDSAISSHDSKKHPNDTAMQTERKSKSRKGGSNGISKTDDVTGSPDGYAKDPSDRTSSKNDKFSGIMSKFQKTVKTKEATKAKEDDEGDDQDSGKLDVPEPVVAHGLEPLPQPEAAPEHVEKPTYSSLPEWLANPLKASVEEKAKFSELNIDSEILRILETNGYKEAFAVQSTVLPLLLPGPNSHPGDLCISAATGSGKTLSYVLPMVNSLQQLPVPMLRGLIVVPTRELVKQARETCELLAAGSGLRIGSAIGNVPIKDEQQSLMRTDPCFSPDAFGQQQQRELDGKDWVDFTVREYFSETEGHYEFLQDYIEKRDPNVDILICTPGRLVDHIHFTKGFSLKYLEWLIIDEADRLLNESFQEWVGAVMTSLDARKAPETFGFSGKLLAEMGLPIQRPEPKKVILSATMTRDISKLSTLRLANPKMVIIGAEGNSQNGEFWQFDDHFALPPTLKEHSVSVGDGAEKPLYLLRLLRSHIKPGAALSTRASDDMSPELEDSTSDDTSSDGSSETSSSGSSESESSDDETSESEASSSEDEEDESKTDSARNTVLIFTKSSESASRLSRLLSILDPTLGDIMGTIIKSNKSSASRKTLSAYRKGKISIIVATDRASRGLDLRSLKHVINYDVPHSITSYVHRVGRTARAGERGDAWTLVAHREGRWFGNQITKGAEGQIVRSTKLERVPMKLDGMAEVKKKYASALEVLEKEVKTHGKTKE